MEEVGPSPIYTTTADHSPSAYSQAHPQLNKKLQDYFSILKVFIHT